MRIRRSGVQDLAVLLNGWQFFVWIGPPKVEEIIHGRTSAGTWCATTPTWPDLLLVDVESVAQG